MLRTLGAPAPARRRRRARPAGADSAPGSLPLTRVTAVHASAPFAGEEEANEWLREATGSEESIERELDWAAQLLNRALHAHAAASGDPHMQALNPQQAAVARLGYGSGEEVAGSSFTQAHELDPRAGRSSRRRRVEQLRPQERVAAVLGGRERIDACETLILRARADLDAGREREAALQLRVGAEALLAELRGALADEGHEEDMATLEARRGEIGDLANAALQGDLDPEQRKSVEDLTVICERVLRRRRVLRV